MTIAYRPTPTSEWRPFADGTFDAASLALANAACGYKKYRLADKRHMSALGEVE